MNKSDEKINGGTVTDRSVPSKTVNYVLILGGMSALGPLSIDMYLPSFPNVAQDLGIAASHIQYTLSSYFLGLAIGQLSYGPISDRMGRKKPLYFGMAIYVFASVLCAFAMNLESLVVGRFLQAIGGSASMVIGRAIVRDRFNEKDSVKIFSLLMLVMGAAPILAPTLGGAMMEFTTWRSIFYFLAAYGTFCIYLTARLDETLSEENVSRRSFGEVIRQYSQLIRHRHLMAYTMTSSICMGAMFGYIAGSPLIFLDRFHIDQRHFGMFFGLNALGVITTSQFNRKLINRYSSVQILNVALLVMAVSSGALLFLDRAGYLSFYSYIFLLFVMVAPLGLVFPNSTAMAMEPMGKSAGTASALMGTLQFGMGAMSTFAVGSIYNGSTIPINALIFVFAMIALLIFRKFCWSQPTLAT